MPGARQWCPGTDLARDMRDHGIRYGCSPAGIVTHRRAMKPAGGLAITASTAFWRMEEATSANRADSAGSITLTNNGAVAQASGKIGNAASFPTSSDYLHQATDTAISGTPGTGAYEVGVWVYLNDVGSSRHVLFENNGGPRANVDTAGKMNWVCGNSQVDTNVLATGTWYAFNLGFTGSGAGASFIILNNGSAVTGTGSANVPADLYVGISAGLTQALNGRLDAFAVWFNYSLTSGERTTWYNGGVGSEFYGGVWH
jgi:hypothetical protein